MSETICPKCGMKSAADSPFCLNCGTTLRGLRIVDMRPTLMMDSRDVEGNVSGGKPEVYRARTAYRSGILEARSALERDRGVPFTPVPKTFSTKKGYDEKSQRDWTLWAIAAIAFLLAVILVVLVVVIAAYI
ncbi:MAG: zinc ribbon domain-containing protein [Syntrophales bacterium]|nr:zinc ribbon domain-containing protein [Syntrophales bacterium]